MIDIKKYKEKFSSQKLAFSYTTSLLFGNFNNFSENKNNNQINGEKNQTYDSILKLVTNYDEIFKK